MPIARSLEAQGITGCGEVHWNLGTAALYEEAIRRNEGIVAEGGPLVCLTGGHTGRSPNDKFLVCEPSTDEKVWWGSVNRPIESDQFSGPPRGLAGRVEREGRFRSRLFCRRRSRISAPGPDHYRTCVAQLVCPNDVLAKAVWDAVIRR